MKVFVSGAGGFIGNAVVGELSMRGHDVIGLVRNEQEGRKVEGAGGRYVKGDLLEAGAWCDEIRHVDKAISLTKPFRTEEPILLEDTDEMGRRHTEAVTNLIQAAADGKARAVVVTHDTLCFGDREGGWVSDTDAIDPVGFCRPLAGSFETITKVGRDADIPLVQIYPAMVYGNGGCFSMLIDEFQSGKAGVVEPGDNYISMIHVEDVAAMYALAVEKLDHDESFNLADDRPVRQRVLMEHIADMLDKPRPRMVDFKSFAREHGVLAAETMSCSTRVQGVKAMGMLDYTLRHKNYEEGVRYTLKSMGIEPRKKAA